MTDAKAKLLEFVNKLEGLRALIQLLEKDLRGEVSMLEDLEEERTVFTSVGEIKRRKQRIKANLRTLLEKSARFHEELQQRVAEVERSIKVLL